MATRAAHGIRTGHHIKPDGKWMRVLSVTERTDLGYIRIVVQSPNGPRQIDYSTMEDVEVRP
jgi:hypothetical protein